ncbi:MAG: cupin domain-containing protein [Chloroflexota bacterium]
MITGTSEGRPLRAGARKIKLWLFMVGSVSALFVMLLTSSFVAGTAFATPGAGVSQTPIASGALPEPIRVKFKQHGGAGDVMDVSHLSMLQITNVDVSNIAVVKNIVQPGGYFGWHQHSGPSWIVVTQGTLTFYDADDPTCAGYPVSAGKAYFDAGNHTHNARNETNQAAENYVVRMFPEGGAARIDMPAPDVCNF